MESVRVYAQCHCKKQTFHVDIAKSSLPLSRLICHCDDCRHITGLLAGDFAELPVLDEDLFDEENCVPAGLSVYRKKGGRINWYFCEECGAHIVQSTDCEDESGKKKWYMSMGTLYPLSLQDGTKTTNLKEHMFVKYGRDQGGISKYLPDGKPRYSDDVSTPASEDEKCAKEEQESIQKAISSSIMPLRCHCGHVQLNVHRPSSIPLAEEWKDCAVNDAWLWTFCLCNSCRTTSGFDLSCFFFAPYTHITGPPGSRHPTDGLKVYSSYPGRQRHFCPTCGACVFFDRSDRGDLCDAFLGLVDIPLAAMFSSWIHKAKKVSFYSHARNKELAECLARGFCPDTDLSPTPNSIKESADYNGTLQV